MADWPASVDVRRLRAWPGALTPPQRRVRAKFTRSNGTRVPTGETVDLLKREVRALRGRDLTVLVAVPENRLRLDGAPRADANPEHPGVVVEFETKQGVMSFPCDTFTDWRDNLRGIAKTLEAMRMIDRYGVTKHGEQYQAFRAIEATPMPAAERMPTTVQESLDVVYQAAEMTVEPGVIYEPDGLRRIIRKAQFNTHPDRGGDATTFRRVNAAADVLRQAGAA